MISIPEGAKVSIEGNRVSVEGPKGKLERTFRIIGLRVESKDGQVVVSSPKLMITNTIESHIENMLIGVTQGYFRKMQILYSHFPITLEVKGSVIRIKNFQGEKKPRRTAIAGQTKVEVKGQEVFVSGIDKEAVGQTVSNLIIATKIRNRDSRVFQDGIYPVEE
jgi:large subunit ribosomal protein L6